MLPVPETIIVFSEGSHMDVEGYVRQHRDGKVKELLVTYNHEFRTGKAMVNGVEVSFDAEWMRGKIGWTPLVIIETLRRMVKDPTNHIVLRWKTKDNPDVVHIDTAVLEFVEKNTDALLVGWAMTEEEVGGVTVFVYNTFDAAFIAQRLELNANFVACALRRLVGDERNFLGLINANSGNPSPIRDYGASRDTKYAAAVR